MEADAEDGAIERALTSAIEKFGSRSDITAIDRGVKYEGGQGVGRSCVRFHVRRKLRPGDVPADLMLPSSIEGVVTDVIEAEYLHQAGTASVKRRGRNEELRPGMSIAAAGCRAGTLGAIVFDRASRQPLLLSVAHVFVNVFRPEVGDRILQPARDDGGNADRDSVATLRRFFQQDSWRSDAAVAELNGSRTFSRVPIGVRQAAEEVGTAQPGTLLQKSGRTTGITEAVVEGRGIYKYPFAPRGVVGFRLRLPPGAVDTPLNDLSGPGDSGALWYGDGGRIAYGLHCAGEVAGDSAEFAVACDLAPILTAFDVTLTT